ncbi:cyclic AMP-dependent transcription factor ATF-5 [Pelobates cultripes]|uniref:Cyclic AMP-dependent transcription factor ATF-5 n=1 Tax=Pelobates cultripes TaxID=61616 RepID=A0AAD1T7Y5_PELCU|nr:cyclic AMP-dependent transcription factor ATF-5 [Pelobates cultripes]
MSLLTALNVDLEMSMLPVSTLHWRADFLKIPVHKNHYDHLSVPIENIVNTHEDGPECLAGDGFTDWMTERVDFSCFLPGTMDSSMPGPPAPDLEMMATLLKKELEQMEDYFLEETQSPGLPMPPDQVAPCTPPSSEGHFLFPTSDQQLGAKEVEFQAYISETQTSPSVSLETLDSGCLELLNLYTDVSSDFSRENLQDLNAINYTSDPPEQYKHLNRPTPYPTTVTSNNTASINQRGDRKQKKRDQNKTAALRYRQRKRAEYDALDEECQGLEIRNRELKEKSDSIEREIQYVKDLLIEVYKARSQRLRNN